MNLPLYFMGVDCETTGSDVRLHQMIELGIYDRVSKAALTLDIGHEEFTMVPEAMAVNGFTENRIRMGLKPEEADLQFESWLTGRMPEGGRVIAVGFNVGKFDLPFIEKTLPKMFKRHFSYRTVDLNAVCFTMGQAWNKDWEGIKRRAKQYAEVEIGGDAQWHDAGYDAKAACYAWEYLIKAIEDY